MYSEKQLPRLLNKSKGEWRMINVSYFQKQQSFIVSVCLIGRFAYREEIKNGTPLFQVLSLKFGKRTPTRSEDHRIENRHSLFSNSFQS